MLSHADNTEDPAPQAAPSSPPPSALRAQRLSPDEARAVIDLWQAEQVEQTGLTDRPAVPDVAEGLDLSVEDVQRLLAEVRARRDAESRLLAQEQELAEIQRQRANLGRVRSEVDDKEVLNAQALRYLQADVRLAVDGERKRRADSNAQWVIALVTVAGLLLYVCIALATNKKPSSAIVPCYVNEKPATAEDCSAIDRGDYSPFIKYRDDNDKR